jgi:hypothetical protein
MIIKLAGMHQPQIPWREQIDLLEVDALTDEYSFDDLLESVEEGGMGVTSARRVATPMPRFQRQDNTVKTATASRWDDEFASAQSHARDLLAKLGNG